MSWPRSCLALLVLFVAVAQSQESRKDRLGDPLPTGATMRFGTIRLRHTAPVRQLAFSPDGRRLAALDEAGALSLWDPATGQSVPGPRRKGPVTAAAFAPDGRLLVVAEGRTVRLWDAAGPREVRSWTAAGPHPIQTVQFTPDGKHLVTGNTAGQAALWDVVTGEPALRRQAHFGGLRIPGQSVALSPDGRRLVAGGLDDLPHEKLRYDVGGRGPCQWSPDGRRLATLEDGVVRLHEAASGSEALRLASAAPARAFAFSPDGRSLVTTTSEGKVELWDARTGACRGRFSAGSQSLGAVAVAPDGKTLAAADTQIHLWDLPGGARRHAAGHTSPVGPLAVSADGTLLATRGTDDRVLLWDVRSGRAHGRLPPPDDRRESEWPVRFSPDGRRLELQAEGRTVAWDLAAGGRRVLASAAGRRADDAVPCPDGRCWAVPVLDGVELRGEGGKVLHRLDHTDARTRRTDLRAMAFSPDGRLLATTGAFEALRPKHPLHTFDSVHIWEVGTGKRRSFRPSSASAELLLFSPDSSVLATAGPGEPFVQLWDTAAAALRHRVAVGGKDGRSWPRRAAFRPDGKLLAVSDAGEFVLIDPMVGREVARRRHGGDVTALGFDRGGTLLFSGGVDETALAWDVPALLGRRAAAGPRALWAGLADADPKQAWAAAESLIGDAGAAVALLDRSLKPVPRLDAARLKRLIAELDHDVFQTREEAARQLGALGPAAVPALRRALEQAPSPEARRRLSALLSDPLPSEVLRGLRAVAVLERVGNRPARAVLTRLASGEPDALLTADARAALGRLAEADRFPGKVPARLASLIPEPPPAEPVEDGRHLFAVRGHIQAVTAVAFSPDGRWVVSAGADGLAHVSDGSTGGLLRTLDAGGQVPRRKDAERGVFALAFSPDGKTLATAAADAAVRLWDPATGRRRAVLEGHEDTASALAFSPDGQTLAAAGHDGTARLWDVATGRERRRLEASRGLVTAVAFSPDGRTLFTGGIIDNLFVPNSPIVEADEVRAWEVTTGAEKARPGFKAHRLALAPGGKTLVAGSQVALYQRGGRTRYIQAGDIAINVAVAVRLCDPASGRERGVRADLGFEAALSADGKLATAPGLQRLLYASGPLSGNTLCYTPPERRVTVRDAATGKVLLVLPEQDVTVLAFSADGGRLVTGGPRGAVHVWDVTADRSAAATLAAARRNPPAAELDRLWDDLAGADASIGQRAFRDLAAAPGPALALVGRRLKPTRTPLERAAQGEGLRTVRAVEVLEAIGTPEARRLLERVAAGEDGHESFAARDALRRLAPR